MNRTKFILIAVTLLLSVSIPAAIFLATTQTPDTAPRAAATRPTTTPIRAEAPHATVAISSDGFFPKTVIVETGARVLWRNGDTAMHQPASDPHPRHDGLAGFDCPEPLRTGDTYGFTFDRPGTYTYHDHLNPLVLRGTVIVR